MESLREQFSDEIKQLIEAGLIEIKSVDADGSFCYGCTELGQKVVNGEATMPDDEKAPV